MSVLLLIRPSAFMYRVDAQSTLFQPVISWSTLGAWRVPNVEHKQDDHECGPRYSSFGVATDCQADCQPTIFSRALSHCFQDDPVTLSRNCWWTKEVLTKILYKSAFVGRWFTGVQK